ncbi:tape measure protein [Flyfo siphovirus Tbat1_6]|uniref:tail length tape measure protein n=1 Tax=Flyfo siphovirus Tbat1_6 TaxID=2907287 RepID=UPI00233ECEA1|nr:tail length tape measure protein [Flyfo siphovirus Tbat1_6]UIW10199.1 tape measure protein [Flyfo siphovirus Tbat1_6]
MAEEVGGIVYEVGMEVSGLTAGAKQAEDALDSIDKSAQDSSKSLGKLDNSSRNAGKGMGSAAGSANSLKTSLTALAGAISVSLIMQWGNAFLEVADNMTQLQARIARLSTDAATAKQTFSDIAAISSRTGSSISDTTKLWETLTSSLKEAGATNAQVLNLTDTLQKIGRIGGSSTEEMANALRQFGQSIASGTIRAEEFNSILEQMPELARQIASGLGISMGELRQRMLEGKLTAQDALNAIQDRTSQINSEFSKLPRTMSQATNSLEVSFATLVAAINNATGASTTMVSIVDSLTSALDRLQGKAMTTSQQIADLASTGEMYARRARTWSWIGVDGWAAQNTGLSRAASLAVDLAGDMQKVTAETGKAADATKHLTIPQAPQASKGKKSEAERQAESIASKLEELRQKSLLTAESTKELSRQQAILAAQQSLGNGATKEQINLAGQYAAKAWDNANALKAQAEAEKKRAEAVKGFAALKSQTSPVFAVETNYQKDLAALNAYAVAYPQKIAEVEQARAAIEEQYRQQRLDAMWQEWSQQNEATQAAAAAFDAFGQTASNALTGVLTGSMSVSEALQSIGSNVLNAVINSFVQMGVEWLKSVIMGQAGMAAASAATAAQAAGIAAAMAPAAAMTSLATGGANAVPAQAGIVSTVGVAKAMSVAGALKNGGPAQAGSMYQVGENNLPEIFQASNGNQYMIPGDNGKVISNKDLTGGGSGLVIYNSVTNYTSSNVTTTAKDNGDGSVTIETIVADIENGGPISQAITSNTTATRKATE